MNKIFLTVFAIFTLFLSFTPVFIEECFAGSPPPPGGGVGPAPCWPPGVCIPIDGGIGFLLAAAAAFGAKKLYDESKKGK